MPWALDLGKANGKLYSIPNEIETLVLYYNKTLFEENGWEPPKTMDELMTLAADRSSDAGIIPFAHANPEWRPANEWFVGEFLNHGAGGPQKVYDALTGKAKWTDPDFVDALTELNDMQQNGWFMGGLDRYYTLTMADVGRDARLRRSRDEDRRHLVRSTMCTISSAKRPATTTSGTGCRCRRSPATPSSISASARTYSINANTKYPDAAAKFLDLLLLAGVAGEAADAVRHGPGAGRSSTVRI